MLECFGKLLAAKSGRVLPSNLLGFRTDIHEFADYLHCLSESCSGERAQPVLGRTTMHQARTTSVGALFAEAHQPTPKPEHGKAQAPILPEQLQSGIEGESSEKE